jgi:hypothetical protein
MTSKWMMSIHPEGILERLPLIDEPGSAPEYSIPYSFGPHPGPATATLLGVRLHSVP